MAYAVACRKGEIGIRLALGASLRHIIWLVLRETLWLTCAGIAIGVPLALWAVEYPKSMLYGIQAADALTLTAAVASLVGNNILAGLFPTRRALRVDPMATLNYE